MAEDRAVPSSVEEAVTAMAGMRVSTPPPPPETAEESAPPPPPPPPPPPQDEEEPPRSPPSAATGGACDSPPRTSGPFDGASTPARGNSPPFAGANDGEASPPPAAGRDGSIHRLAPADPPEVGRLQNLGLVLHELTPVIRNTSEEDQYYDSLAPVVSLHGAGGHDDLDDCRRQHLLSLSVPDSGGPSSASKVLERRRPLPQAVGRGARPMLRMEVPLPPRSLPRRPVDMGAAAANGLPKAPVVPLRPTPAVRTQSAGNLDTESLVKTYKEHAARQANGEHGADDDFDDSSFDDADPDAAARLLRESQDDPGQPIELSDDKHSHSFTGPSQYRHRISEPDLGASPVSSTHPPSSQAARAESLLKPYQPIRENSFEVGVKRVEPEALDSIFQRGSTPRSTNSACGGGGRPPLPSQGDSSESPARLPQPVPLAERDWSIPSLHMGHRLRESNASYTSYTCSEDEYTEEDNLCRDYDDDASISTRGSIDASGHDLFRTREALSGGIAAISSAERSEISEPEPVGGSDTEEKEAVIEDGIEKVVRQQEDLSDSGAAVVDDAELRQELPAEDVALELPVNGSHHNHKKSRKDDKSEREKNAIEWLRNVEAGGISEAASSKFLMGPQAAHDPLLQKPYPVDRQFSSPAQVAKASS